MGATGATGATGAAPVDETPDQQLERAINDPLPNALKKETKERFGMVVTALKDRTHQLQQVTGDLDTMLDSIQQTRATPAQYKQALDYLTLVNSDSAEDKQKALEFMQREIRALAVMIGKPVPGVNFLEGHQDLIQEVGEGKITPQRAMEIAAAREHNKRNAEVTQRVTAANNEQQTRQQVEARGRAELNALEQALKADPAYPAKRKILVESLRPVFAQIHPSQWAATFKRAYDNLPAPVAPVAPAPAAPVVKAPANTPLRASNPAGGQVAAPASALEALNAGIAAAG